MIKRECKYCNKELEFDNGYQFGAHIRNCKYRPDIKEINDRARKNQTKRKLHDIQCQKCDKIYQLNLTDYEIKIGKHRKYCSPECRKKEKVEKICLNCKKILIKGQKKYCNHTCQHEYKYNEYIKRWKEGLEEGLHGENGENVNKKIRKYLFKKYNNKCERCKWSIKNEFTNKIPLTVHHKDGNYKNNKEVNLELLCPNCHSLTDNYGSRNKSSSKTKRSEWRKKVQV
jgi:hypothetical protein